MGASQFVKLLIVMGASQFVKLLIVMGASQFAKLLIVMGASRFGRYGCVRHGLGQVSGSVRRHLEQRRGQG